MEPLSNSRSSTFSMSNWAYFASRTPSATFSKSQNTARLRDSGLSGTDFLSLRLLQPGLQALEIEVDNGSDVERQHLREQQAAYHGEAERHARAAAGTEADRDRQAAHECRHGGHHDRPEADQPGLVDRLRSRHALAALRLDGEVDHHDGVFLDDAHQHDDADERVHVELEAEGHQREQRAQARGGQARKNRERVNEALGEDAEHQINHYDREQDQEAHALERALVGLRRSG